MALGAALGFFCKTPRQRRPHPHERCPSSPRVLPLLGMGAAVLISLREEKPLIGRLVHLSCPWCGKKTSLCRHARGFRGRRGLGLPTLTPTPRVALRHCRRAWEAIRLSAAFFPFFYLAWHLCFSTWTACFYFPSGLYMHALYLQQTVQCQRDAKPKTPSAFRLVSFGRVCMYYILRRPYVPLCCFSGVECVPCL